MVEINISKYSRLLPVRHLGLKPLDLRILDVNAIVHEVRPDHRRKCGAGILIPTLHSFWATTPKTNSVMPYSTWLWLIILQVDWPAHTRPSQNLKYVLWRT